MSPAAWVVDHGAHGDYSRPFVLDAPMLDRVNAGRFPTALDVALGEMVRVLRPGGSLLVANLNGSATAERWSPTPGPDRRFSLDRYLEPRAEWVEWRGIRIRNWHRPLSAYVARLLACGLTLRYFSEPAAVGGDPAKAAEFDRVPWFVVMEWVK